MSKKSPEDAFYDNLLLGLNTTLSKSKNFQKRKKNTNSMSKTWIAANVPRICNVSMEKRSPCEKANIITWEQRHGVYLPEDIKKFYLSTDGFLLQWSYQYARKFFKANIWNRLPVRNFISFHNQQTIYDV